MAATNRPITRALEIAYQMTFDQMKHLASHGQTSIMGAKMPLVDRGETVVADLKAKERRAELAMQAQFTLPDPRKKPNPFG